MANIYIFRGKSATGKTTITNILSKKINVCVLRKDDVFDPLSNYISDNAINNEATYNILANIIQINIDNDIDVIIDIALPHNDYFKMFIAKIKFDNHKIFLFLCDCLDMEVWKSRWTERLKFPKPNQYFTNLNEIINHYDKMNIELLPNETYIDSAKYIENIMNCIYDII